MKEHEIIPIMSAEEVRNKQRRIYSALIELEIKKIMQIISEYITESPNNRSIIFKGIKYTYTITILQELGFSTLLYSAKENSYKISW